VAFALDKFGLFGQRGFAVRGEGQERRGEERVIRFGGWDGW